MEVYLDVLLLENILMNYLILAVTSKFLKKKVKSLRLLLGAFIGAVYVIILLFLPQIHIYYSLSAKLILSVVIVGVTFFPKKLREFIKTITCFYMSTFIFAGAAFAFLSLNQGGGIVRNGAFYVYMNSKMSFILIAALVTLILIRAFYQFIKEYGSGDKVLVSLYVVFDGNGIWVPALVDTGNQLKDPLSGAPVIIVEAQAIKSLLPLSLAEYMEQQKDEEPLNIELALKNTGWFSRFRLVPFTSLGKENGILLGFRPDYIEVGKNGERKETKDVVICLYNRKLSENSTYHALLAPELVA